MPTVAIPLVGPTYTDRSLDVSAQVTRNFYIEVNQEATDVVAFHPFPGLTLFATAGTGPDRGITLFNDMVYKVTGGKLCSVSLAGVSTEIGDIEGDSPVVFANDGTYLIITTGVGKPYTYDGTTLAQGTNVNLPSASTVAYINRRVIYDGSANNFAFADLDDPLTVQSSNVALAESKPGDAMAVFTYAQKVYLMCIDKIEPWYNTGVGNPPYSRIDGSTLEIGLGARYSVASNRNAVYFLGEDRVPYRIVGLQADSIGNPAIGQAFEKYAGISDARGMCFQFDNMNFYLLTFGVGNESWLFNEAAGAWTNLAYGVNGDQHLISSYVRAYNKHLVSDRRNGNIYYLDFDNYTDNGDVIQRQRDTVKVSSAAFGYPGRDVFMSRLEIYCERGVGITTGQGSDPRIMMSYSDDGGRTWSSERWEYLGVQGDYGIKIEWFNLGMFRERIFRFKVSDPVKVVLKKLEADVTLSNR